MLSSGARVVLGAPEPLDVARKVEAVLGVLRGEEEHTVAARNGVEVALLRRWVVAFVEAGRAALVTLE